MSKTLPMVTPGVTRVGQRITYSEYKVCIHCHRVKHVEQFYAMPSRKGALASYCKRCQRVIFNEWQKRTAEQECRQAYDEAARALKNGQRVVLRELPKPVRAQVVRALLAAGRSPRTIAYLASCQVDTVRKYIRLTRSQAAR